jgi:hypothetical protein
MDELAQKLRIRADSRHATARIVAAAGPLIELSRGAV